MTFEQRHLLKQLMDRRKRQQIADAHGRVPLVPAWDDWRAWRRLEQKEAA